MVRPRAMYLEHDKDKGIITAHYGKAKPIMEFYQHPDFGVMDKHFEHPTRNFVYSFRETEEPVVHQVAQKNGKILNQIKKDAKKRKIHIYNQNQIYSAEHLIMAEVPMGQYAMSKQAHGGLYTENLATCIGIAMRNPENQRTSLFHTPGCEREMMPHILDTINSQIEYLEKHPELEVTVGSGLVNMCDEEVIEIISDARENLEMFFFDLDIEPTMHLAESEEMISFMSINPNDGLVDVIKKSIY